MAGKIMSPDYPGFGLDVCLDKGRELFEKLQTFPGNREFVATGLGYKTLNGASMSAIAAMQKFGLLEPAGKTELKFSDLGLRIFAQSSPEDRAAAIEKAAFTPTLFSELRTSFNGTIPDDQLLRNWLTRHGFVKSAVERAFTAFKQTVDIVKRETGGYHPSRVMPQTNESEAFGQESDKVAESGQREPVGLGAKKIGTAMPELQNEQQRSVVQPPTATSFERGIETNQYRVTVDGSRVEIHASVDLKGLRRLMKMLKAQEAIISDPDDSDEVE